MQIKSFDFTNVTLKRKISRTALNLQRQSLDV